MNGIDFLADTNAILYFLAGNQCMRPFISCKFAYSIISEMELLSYSKLKDEEEKRIKAFLSECNSIDITNNIRNRTIMVRKNYNIKLPDAIIAASAIENDLILITADAGFKKIKELNLNLITPVIS